MKLVIFTEHKDTSLFTRTPTTTYLGTRWLLFMHICRSMTAVLNGSSWHPISDLITADAAGEGIINLHLSIAYQLGQYHESQPRLNSVRDVSTVMD